MPSRETERAVAEVVASYRRLRPEIEARLACFDRLWASATEEDLFAELVYCIFTPASRADRCWEAVEGIRGDGLLLRGDARELSDRLCRVRFRHTKARRVVAARALFTEGGLRVRPHLGCDPREAREWLVSSVDGLGYKEASHFLRNIGRGRRLAILDRHVLRNLEAMGAIPGVPGTMTPKRYLGIERAMASFSDAIGVPMDALDLVLWHRQTGRIFK